MPRAGARDGDVVSVFIEFDEVDDFSAAAIGEPGSRVFYLTARAGGERVAVRCEKQQVAAIATYLRHVLSDLPPVEDRPLLPAGTAAAEPTASFVLGPIGLGYDRRHDRLLVQLEEFVETGESTDSPGGSAASDDDVDVDRGHIRLYVSRSQASAFCDHADGLVAAGRPTCTWCSRPIDPDGHPCPRMN